MNPQQTIDKVFAGTPFLVRGKAYHSTLPADLAPWYCYTQDGGHSILCLLEGSFEEGEDLTEALIPAPVKTVLRGYRLQGGYVVATTGFQYSEEVGLITDPKDDEF